MSEWIATHITIGGRIAESLAAALCQAIGEEGGGLDWGDDPFRPQRSEQLLAARQQIGDTLVLRLFDETASGGRFESLEAFLVEHGIAFDRQHEAKFDVSAGRLVYRPGIGIHEFLTDAEEKIVIRAEPLRGIAETLAQVQLALSAERSVEAGSLLAGCLLQIQAALPPELPALPSLEIVPTDVA